MDPFSTQSFDPHSHSHSQQPAAILRSPFNPGLQCGYDTPGAVEKYQHDLNHHHGHHHGHGLNSHDHDQQNLTTLPSTPQQHVSQTSQESNTHLHNIHDSTLGNIDFDSSQGLDIHLSYDSVGVGVGGGIGLDDVDFDGRDPWLTPTPGEGHHHHHHHGHHGHGHFDDGLDGQLDVDVDVDVDAGGEGWYEGLGQGVGVGVEGCQWDDGIGELGGGGVVGNGGGVYGSGNGSQEVGGNISIGTS